SWKGLSLNYASVLQNWPGREAETRTTLQESSAPRAVGSAVEWSSPRLKVAGRWEADAGPIKRILLESSAGKIEWHCLQPRARAEIRVGENVRLVGLGYVEQLTMTIPPWRLPFEELRWGRFLSAEDSLVWIDWRGAHPLNLTFHNGALAEHASLADDRLAAGELSLALDCGTVLREGTLAETALNMIPGIDRLFPFRILRAHERKWLSHGVLKKPAAEPSTGWAIHEVVRWPRQKKRGRGD
ncbi:MAG TPA: hypothetical protein VD861_16550, partial [Pyrinomonadaceae bacterium]|nr:hypothetical protein [Pyrinomonadaceae bacterium]